MTSFRPSPRIGVAVAGVVAIAIGIAVFSHRGPSGCFDGDPKAVSPVADPAFLAGTTRVKGSNQLAVDVVRGEMLGTRSKIAVPAGDVVTISGWAADTLAKDLVRAVLVRTDDGPAVRADTCGARNDVAGFFKNPALANSGWAVRLRPAPGVHRVAFDVLGADGRTVYTDIRTVELDGTAAAGPGAGPPVVQGAFTYFDDVTIPEPILRGAPYPHPLNTDFRITAWMVDQTRGAPAPVRAIDVLVDGKVVDRAAYGASRPDVAAFVHAPDVQNAGFSARFPTDGLALGRHVISFRVTVADGRTTMFGTTVPIDLVPAASPAPVPSP